MKYNINNNNLQNLILDIENNLEIQRKTFNELLKIDQKYCKIKTNLELIQNTLEELKNEKIDRQKEEKILIIYNGNPCITVNLCILAILTKSTIVLDFNESMIGINSFIIETINESLKKFKTDKLIYSTTKKEKKEDINKIICIDDVNSYNLYLREKNEKARYYSYNYLDLYSDSDDYEEIEDLIYQIAEENKIPVEAYSELDTEDAVNMIKNGYGKNVVLLTNNEETKQFFKENIKNKKLYINKNPFELNKKAINKEIMLI